MKTGRDKRYVVPPCFKFGTFLQQCIDFCLDGIFRSCPYEFVVHLAAGLDEYDERDISYREFHGEVVVLVDIAFADDYLAFILFGELFDDGGQRAARTAPFCPEVDNERFAGSDEFVVSGGINDFAIVVIV